MSRLLKSDFRKLFKGKSFWVCSIIILLLGIGLTFLFHAAYDLLISNMGMGEILAMSGASVNIPFLSANAWSVVQTFFGDSDIVTLLSIAMVLFITSEYTAGTYKNSISRGFSRTAVYLSKFIVSLFIMFVLSLLYLVPAGVTAGILYGDWGSASVQTVVTVILINLLELIAFTAFLTMLSFMIKSTGGAIALTLVLISIVPTILEIFNILFENSNLSQYWPPSLLTQTSTFMDNGKIWIPIVVSLVYLAASLFLGLFTFNKKDIK